MRFLLLVMLAGMALTAAAQQYRWVDEKGRVHYTDTPPPPSAKGAQKKDLRGNTVGAQENFELSQAMRSAPVKLYSVPECQDPCQEARNVLNKRGIPFAEVSVTDEAKIAELKRVSGGMRVPVMMVGGQVELNFSEEAYNRALDIAGYPRAGVVARRNQGAPPPPPPAAPVQQQQGQQQQEAPAPPAAEESR